MIKLPNNSILHFKEQLDAVFSSGQLAEGRWNEQIINWAKDYTGAKSAAVTCSNGGGILALLMVLKRYRGFRRVLIQANTMYGVKTMVLTAGLELSGVIDCSLKHLMPTYASVQAALADCPEPRRTILLLTHIGGWINPEIKEIARYCAAKRVALIEDCAHSLGATLDGEHSGLYGLAGVYSLYATKAIPAGEGGIVVTNDEELGEMTRRFAIYDRFKQEMDIGVNVRMSEVSALLAYSVLRETENVIADKMATAKRYVEACKNVGLEYLAPEGRNWRSNLYKFIVFDRSSPLGSLRINRLKTKTSSVYDYCLGKDPDQITKRHACLPIWYLLNESVVEKVCKEIETCA